MTLTALMHTPSPADTNPLLDFRGMPRIADIKPEHVEPAIRGLIDENRVTGLAEGLTEAEAGKRLLELAAACRRAGIDPESALRRETLRVTAAVEERAAARNG